ncbi:hypothetical protein [Streptomyces sp. TS71-3]|uniref:hypothetical protein n=1 Tax=Streptomyces sp. TS71-3 TaxID=2733862 RepID=UPI001BB344CF|nr:hypothetical protein [Streptomyces sp. TS71-3]
MPETPDTKPSAVELNQRIRDLMLRSGGRLSGQQRAEYQLLLSRWAAAVREDIVTAA